MERGVVHIRFYWENLREGDHLEETGVDGRIILKWIFERLDGGGGHGLDQSGSGQGQVAGFCECGNEPSGFVKCGVFLEKLRTY
jgi:hypothetical protein